MRRPSTLHQSGLSLIEILLTMAIISTVLGTALPAMGELLDRQRAAAGHNQLMASFSQARSQAITTRVPAMVCPSADGLSCTPGGVWEAGWIAFLDRNRSGTFDAGDTLLQHESIGIKGMRVRSSTGRPALTFLPDGRSPGSNLTLKLCDEAMHPMQAIIVNNTGRARHADDRELAAMTPCG